MARDDISESTNLGVLRLQRDRAITESIMESIKGLPPDRHERDQIEGDNCPRRRWHEKSGVEKGNPEK